MRARSASSDGGWDAGDAAASSSREKNSTVPAWLDDMVMGKGPPGGIKIAPLYRETGGEGKCNDCQRAVRGGKRSWQNPGTVI